MKALTFILETLEPLLIASPLSGDENSATGLDFIPGSVVRGALAQAFAKGKAGNLQDAQFKSLFFGTTSFLNAYPLLNGQRSLPTPMSLHRPKEPDANDPIYDLAVFDDLPEKPLKRIGEAFAIIAPPPVALDDDDDETDEEQRRPLVGLAESTRHLAPHILQTDRLNAVQTASGTVFRYDALAAGQFFSGAILSDTQGNLDQLRDLLKKTPLKLGKSRSAGYGAVRVVRESEIQADWQECAPMPAKLAENPDRVIVTLLSDALVRDPQTGAFASSLAPIFGTELKSIFARTHIVGGFNVTWGLPLPQARALQAGSVFVFKRTPALVEQLQVAKDNGLGERCIDGYGRIGIDWHVTQKLEVASLDATSGLDESEDKELKAGAPEHALAQLMVNRMRRAQLDAALRNTIGRAAIKPPMNNAQLSRIRVLAREAWRQNDPRMLADVLKAPEEKNGAKTDKAKDAGMKQTARDQFEGSRISTAGSTNTLLKWLQALAEDPAQVWNELGVHNLTKPVIGKVDAQDPPALEYAARLIDGVLRKAAREGE